MKFLMRYVQNLSGNFIILLQLSRSSKMLKWWNKKTFIIRKIHQWFETLYSSFVFIKFIRSTIINFEGAEFLNFYFNFNLLMSLYNFYSKLLMIFSSNFAQYMNRIIHITPQKLTNRITRNLSQSLIPFGFKLHFI